MKRSKHVLDVEHLPALTPDGVATAALVTMALAGLLLLTGLVEVVGVTGLSQSVRTGVWVGATPVYALSLFAVSRTLAARFGDESLTQAETALSSSDDRSAEEGDAGDLQSADGEAAGPPFAARSTRSREGLGRLPGFRGVSVIVALAGLAALGSGLSEGPPRNCGGPHRLPHRFLTARRSGLNWTQTTATHGVYPPTTGGAGVHNRVPSRRGNCKWADRTTAELNGFSAVCRIDSSPGYADQGGSAGSCGHCSCRPWHW